MSSIQIKILFSCSFFSKTFNFSQQVPTDAGMCCAFNKKEADKIFIDSKYTQILKKLNSFEKNLAFDKLDETPISKLDLIV